jgi:LDH2 family malate/lactate/ureidoglycolate dehydrogenase
MSDTESLRYRAADLLELATRLLEREGLPSERACVVAEVLLEGDLLGRTTHGLDLLAKYLRELAEGKMAKDGEPAVLNDRGAALTWDGRRLPGPWLVTQAIGEAQRRLKDHPLVSVVIRRSHHIACLQAYLRRATDEGQVILLTCSDPSAGGVTPHGGIASRITPNPIAAGFPTEGDPVLIDVSMATTTSAMSRRVFDAGERLPGDWLVDADGHATNDPAALFGERPGAVLPLGRLDLGHKGFAMALLVEALTSALGGYGRAEKPKEWTASIFLMLIDPDAFGGREAFLRETTALGELCRATPVAPGRPAVRLPGAEALRRRTEQLRDGVALHPTILPALVPWAENAALPLPRPIV